MSSASSLISTDRRISRAESWAVLVFSIAASVAAIAWSWNHGAMLNYGDAVAHLHIARRVFDSRTPRLTQLGSVWLPLPHILLIPFAQDNRWWVTGFAGVIPSALAYLASCAGLYRLARHWMSPAAAATTLVFFALNPNLLYMQTTAMTEPLFLCEAIWIMVWLVEWSLCLDEDPGRAARLQLSIAVVLIAAIFTRYDGWIIALVAWMGISLMLLWRALRGKHGRLGSPGFWIPTIAVVAAPILWFLYNSAGFGDWLYFARGPFSAKAIELRSSGTAPGWPPHPGWHDARVALLYYVKVAELDFAAAPAWKSFWGNAVVAIAALGTAFAWFADKTPPRRRASAWLLLLWLPAAFYTWSVAYGSVPIFFPAWWPYTWYNTRYGLEMLPALALGLGLAAQAVVSELCRLNLSHLAPRFPKFIRLQPILPVALFGVFIALAAMNTVALVREGPIVYIESTTNLEARQPYDEAIPPLLEQLLAHFPQAPVLMNTSAYPEIVAMTGIPLRETINESDLEIFDAALVAPATHAAIVVTFDGDVVDRAVQQHPEGLNVAGRFTAPGQPTATIYVSRRWMNHSAQLPDSTSNPAETSSVLK
jgi:hypothetical protein